MSERNPGPDWTTSPAVLAACNCGWECHDHQANAQAVLCVRAHRTSDPRHRDAGYLAHGDALKSLAFAGKDLIDGVQ